jgi:hypothetical protein
MRRLLAIALAAASLSAGGAAQAATAATTRPEDVATQQDFIKRVNDYYTLRNKLGANDTKQSESAAEVANNQDQLAAKVRQQRAKAKHEDIFTDKVEELFRREIKASYRGGNGSRIETSLNHAEPTPKIELRVNAKYPSSLPLQSTPPTLLQNLPRLPKGLEYRVVGRDLILYDSATNLIVDYIHEAMPSR